MKFHVDHCLSKRHVEALSALLTPHHTFRAHTERFPAETPDEEWISKLADENENWIILSSDFTMLKNVREREAIGQAGLTAFILTKGWQGLRMLPQHWNLVKVMDDEILQLASAHPRGAVFTVSKNGQIKREW